MAGSKLYHDHDGTLHRLAPGGEMFVQKILYTRWFCQECKAITLVPKELVPA